jgi:hypothetical protein
LRFGAKIVDAHPVVERGALRSLIEQASTGAQADAVAELRHRFRRLEQNGVAVEDQRAVDFLEVLPANDRVDRRARGEDLRAAP